MNKHVSKLSREANEARRMLEDSESDSDDTSGVDKKRSTGGRQGGRGGEKPSEDHVEKLEEKLEAAQADQKNLFLIIFQVILLLLKPEIAHGSTAYIKYLPPFLFLFSKTKQF